MPAARARRIGGYPLIGVSLCVSEDDYAPPGGQRTGSRSALPRPTSVAPSITSIPPPSARLHSPESNCNPPSRPNCCSGRRKCRMPWTPGRKWCLVVHARWLEGWAILPHPTGVEVLGRGQRGRGAPPGNALPDPRAPRTWHLVDPSHGCSFCN